MPKEKTQKQNDECNQQFNIYTFIHIGSSSPLRLVAQGRMSINKFWMLEDACKTASNESV